MKKYAAKLSIALVAVMMLSLALLVGCGNDPVEILEPGPSSLAGTSWMANGVEVEGTVVSGDDIEEQLGGEMKLTFGDDGNVTVQAGDVTQTLQYTYEGNEGVIEDPEAGNKVIRVVGDVLQLEQGSQKITFFELDI